MVSSIKFIFLLFLYSQSLHYNEGVKKIIKDIRFMLGFGVGIYWKFTWTIFIPLALLVRNDYFGTQLKDGYLLILGASKGYFYLRNDKLRTT